MMLAQTLGIGGRPDWHLWLVIVLALVALYHSAAWLAEVHEAERRTRR